jgi:flavorubredoxin
MPTPIPTSVLLAKKHVSFWMLPAIRRTAPSKEWIPESEKRNQPENQKAHTMTKALVVYATRTGETRKIGELIAEGLRFSGVDATVKDSKEITKQSDLEGYDAVVLGAATYHGEMMPAMKTLLFLAEKAGLESKVGGAFGAFGWSGEAPDRIFDTMKNIFKMNMANNPLRLKSTSLGGGIKMAQDYGREIAKKLEG